MRYRLAIVVVVASALWPSMLAAQPPDKAAVIRAIEERAQTDARRGREASPTDLDLLFGDEARNAGLTLREVSDAYDAAHQRATPPASWWARSGTAVSIALALLVVFRNFVVDTLTKLLVAARERLYERLAGYRLARRAAVRRYRSRVVQTHERFRVPFLRERALDVRAIYVPLRVKSAPGRPPVDATRAMRDHQRVVVVGPPGAGKSMLLRRLALDHADRTEAPLPVLLELRRMNDGDRTVLEHLPDVFERNGFPRAEAFIRRAVTGGACLLLLDGFDEVNASGRERVARRIADFLEQHDRCTAVITCRSAVYRDEFAAVTSETFELAEFDDQQIQRFLHTWAPFIPAGKSVEQLIGTLQERPRIMALARNPLLLTIIASLYADTAFVLPHSRTEFYERAVDVMLGQWKDERNRFKAPHKRLVLQRLALFNQDRARRAGSDRQALELSMALKEISALLPDLNLRPEDAQSILDEIVERSGLMLPVDGGTRYQFAHLTLQEFFAAVALDADEPGLLKRFVDDRDTWRESVRLWCGLGHDSTGLIDRVEQIDPVTAFECLAEAQQVSAELAGRIVASFESQLTAEGPQQPAIVRAFAAVAGESGQRGRAVFELLVRHARATDHPTRLAAATALALTNVPAAAATLDELSRTGAGEALGALTTMGDLALPHLVPRATAGETVAVAALWQVGTAQAAAALARLMWNDTVGSEAAPALGDLLRRPEIEEALRGVEVPPNPPAIQSEFDFVWAPFGEPPASALPRIAARAAALLDSAVERSRYALRPYTIDPRLVIPLLVKHATEFLRVATHQFTSAERATFEASKAKEETDAGPATRRILSRMHAFVESSTPHPPSALWMSLPEEYQLAVVFAFWGERVPTIDDWRNVFKPVRFQFRGSRQQWTCVTLLLALTVCALGGFGAAILRSPSWPVRAACGLGIAVIGLFVPTLGRMRSFQNKNLVDWFIDGWRRGAIPLVGLVRDPVYFLIAAPPVLIGPVVMAGSWLLVAGRGPAYIAPWIAMIVTAVALRWFGLRKEHKAGNPLHGLLDKPSEKIARYYPAELSAN